MRVLFLENQDSFSWNVVDALPFRRDEVELRPGRKAGPLTGFDALVVGPGPTDPVRAGLVEVVHRAAAMRLPLLGICLGHQAIGLAFGASLVRTRPAHGRRDTAVFADSRSFPGFSGPQTVMRYHSLSLAQASIRAPLCTVAALADGTPMAIEHESLPIAGVQFHPDSYATPRGRELLAAFFQRTA